MRNKDFIKGEKRGKRRQKGKRINQLKKNEKNYRKSTARRIVHRKEEKNRGEGGLLIEGEQPRDSGKGTLAPLSKATSSLAKRGMDRPGRKRT